MLAARVATAIGLLAACLAAIWFLPGLWWSAVLLPVLAMASWEWGRLAGYGRAGRWTFCTITLGSAVLLFPMAAVASHVDRIVYGASCAFWIVLVPVWLARRSRIGGPIVQALIGWVVLVPTWVALVRLQSSPEQLVALLGIVWLADSAAYFAGRAWGRHRLAPAISPGKTWEGLAGAALVLAVYYVLLSRVTAGWPGWQAADGMILFAGVAVLSVVGDLFESWIKRQAGAKDSGTLLPGHGGVLDRIDGLTASLPFAAAWVLHLA
jgi:phosphatidate cytidylyltransferase